MERDPRIDEVHWYHTIDLGDGLRTIGEFNTDAALARLPFPASLAGKRCLDVGTRDGFWAFAMEARGAAEVVGIDVDHPLDLDNPWLPAEVRQRLADSEAEKEAKGFHLAHELRGSKVQRVTTSVYDLDPAEIGTFDFAYIGTMLLHLRDPIGALDGPAARRHRAAAGERLDHAGRAVRHPGPVGPPAGLPGPVLVDAQRRRAGPLRRGSRLPASSRDRSSTRCRSTLDRTPGQYRDRGSLTRREWARNKLRKGVAHAWILAEPNPG